MNPRSDDDAVDEGRRPFFHAGSKLDRLSLGGSEGSGGIARPLLAQPSGRAGAFGGSPVASLRRDAARPLQVRGPACSWDADRPGQRPRSRFMKVLLGAGSQTHRCEEGTPAITASTCCPQPRQVVFLHREH